jgi:hypothetical protein
MQRRVLEKVRLLQANASVLLSITLFAVSRVFP